MSRTVTTARQLRHFRRDQGWTQAYAANWAGITARQWRRYEAGDSPGDGLLPLWLTRRIQEFLLFRRLLEQVRPDLVFDPITYTLEPKHAGPE